MRWPIASPMTSPPVGSLSAAAVAGPQSGDRSIAAGNPIPLDTGLQSALTVCGVVNDSSRSVPLPSRSAEAATQTARRARRGRRLRRRRAGSRRPRIGRRYRWRTGLGRATTHGRPGIRREPMVVPALGAGRGARTMRATCRPCRRSPGPRQRRGAAARHARPRSARRPVARSTAPRAGARAGARAARGVTRCAPGPPRRPVGRRTSRPSRGARHRPRATSLRSRPARPVAVQSAVPAYARRPPAGAR
jgi:hypothetical protein